MKKKILLAAGAGAVLLTGALAALPLLLSSAWVREFALSRLNHGTIPGELAAEDCAVTWRRGLGCSGVVYHDAKQGLRLELAGLRSSQGLWPLLTAPKELGEITLDSPVLELTAAPEPKAPAEPASGPPVKQEKPAEQTAQTPPAATKTTDSARLHELLNTVQGRLTVTQAEVRIVRPGQQPEIYLRNGLLKAEAASGEVKFELTADSGQEGGATASGTVRLADVLQGGMAGTDLRLKLAKVQVKPFLTFQPDNLPQGSGSLSADVRLEGAADGSMTLRGPLSLRDADLSGGPLGKDNPRFSQLALELDLKKDGAAWQFPALKAVSDFGNLELQCAYSSGGFKGSGSGRIDLSLLLAQFPRLLNVRDDLRLDKGELRLSADLSKENGILRLNAEAAADSLAGRQNGQAFAWEQPLRLELAGSLAGQEPEVERLHLSAPFLELEGRGGRKQFSLNGAADIDQAMQEVNRIFRTGWDAGGQLELTAQLTEQEGDRYLIETKAEIADSRLSRQGQELLPPGKTSLNARLDTPGQFPENSKEAAELHFDLSSWAGSLSGTVDGLHRKNGQISAGYQVQTQLLLGRAVELLHKFGLLKQETSLGGSFSLNASGYTEDGRVVLRELDSRVKDFILYQQGKVFRDPELRLATLPPETAIPAAEKTVRPLIEADSRSAFFADGGGFSLLDSASRRLNLRDLDFSSSSATIRLRQLALDDWRNKPMPVLRRLQVSGQSDLSKLTVLLQQLGTLSPDKKLGGNGSFAVELASQEEIGGAAGKGSSGTVEIDLERFMYGNEGGLIAAKEKVEFRSKLHGDLAGGDIYFTTFDLSSPPLTVQSSGKLELAGKTPHFALEGAATPDLADLVALLNGMYPLGISAEGRQKEKFSLYYPLSGGRRQIDLKFASRVHADTFVKSGILVTDLVADTSMKDGVMNAAFKGGLNGGTMQFTPKIDYTRSPPLLTLAEPEQVLDRVSLAETLADGLLKSFHPLLGALARPAGTISVRAERLSLPIGGNGLEQADFNLCFDLASVLFEPASVLTDILELAGLNSGQTLQLAEKTLTCEGKKGRISCSPIKMTVADSTMVLSGSAGFDGSLDYVLEVPVTKNLVGKKGYELLKGVTLKVPIKGSKDKPAYSPEALRKAASDLLRQAAGHAAEQAVKEQVRKVLPKELDKALPGLFDGLLGR